MPSGANIRAGGAYVEAYVDSSKMDPQLTAVNQKVRASVSLARTSLAMVGHGSAVGGAAMLGSMAVVGRAALGFAKGFSTPGNQASQQMRELTGAVNALQPSLAKLQSPVKELFSRFTGGIAESSLNLKTMRSLMENVLPKGMAKQFGESMRKMGDGGRAGANSITNAFSDSLGGKLASRAAIVAWIFGDKLQLELARNAKRATDAMRIDFSSQRSLSEGLTTWLVVQTRRGFIGATGATVSALNKFTGDIAGRLGRGFQAALRAVTGRKLANEVNAVGQSAARATPAIQRAGDAATSTGSRLGKLSAIGSQAAGTFMRIGAVAGGIVGLMAGAAAFNTGSLQAAFTSFKDFNPATAKQSADALGLTVEQMTRLGSAAELSGSSLDSVKGAMSHISDLAKNDSDQFSKFGLSLQAMKDGSPERRLELVAMALNKISDPAKRSAAAMSLLGTNDLGPMLADLDGFRSKAEQLGGVLSSKDVAASLAFKNSIGEMHLASKTLGQTLSAAVIPQLMSMVQTTTTAVNAVREWASANPQLIGQIFTVAKSLALFASVGGTAWAIGSRLAFLGPLITAALPFAPIIAGTAAIVGLALAMTPLGGKAVEAFSMLKEAALGAFDPIMEGIAVLKADFGETWDGIVDALSAGDLSLAAEIAIDGVKLIFSRGFAALHSYLMDFSNDWLSVWDTMTSNVRVAGEDMFPGFESVWSETMSFITDAWTVSWNAMLATFDHAFAWLQKGINYLKRAFDSAFDFESANKKIDDALKKSAEGRGAKQDDLIGKREAERDKHKANVKQKGLRGTLDEENDAARAAREKAAADARQADQNSIVAAKEKLRLAREKAAAAKKTREHHVKTANATAAETAKKGGADASRKGFEASDIRSKEGLSAVASTARGKSPMDKSIDLQSKSLAEQKKQSDLQYKIWKQQQDGLVPAFPGS